MTAVLTAAHALWPVLLVMFASVILGLILEDALTEWDERHP